jgi:RNA polymerase sigma-32 factor
MKEKERIEKLGFRPDTKALAAALEVRPEEVEEMESRLGKSDLSLDAKVGEDGERRQIDLMAAEAPPMEEMLDQAHFKDILEQKLTEFAKTLDEREEKIFRDRLLSELPLTLQTIANEYGISRERARQIEEKIKSKLKDYFKKEGLKIEEHF